MNELLVQLQMKMEAFQKDAVLQAEKETRQPASVPAVYHSKWNRC